MYLLGKLQQVVVGGITTARAYAVEAQICLASLYGVMIVGGRLRDERMMEWKRMCVCVCVGGGGGGGALCVKKKHYPPCNRLLATSKNVLFPGYNHLLTTSADDPSLFIITLAGTRAIIKVFLCRDWRKKWRMFGKAAQEERETAIVSQENERKDWVGGWKNEHKKCHRSVKACMSARTREWAWKRSILHTQLQEWVSPSWSLVFLCIICV